MKKIDMKQQIIVAFMLLGLFGIYLVKSGYFEVRGNGFNLLKPLLILGIAFIVFLFLSMMVTNIAIFVRDNFAMLLKIREKKT